MSKAKRKKNPNQMELPEFIDRIELKHPFSDQEKGKLLHELTCKQEELAGLINLAKASARQWKARIEEANLKINELSAKGRNGFEMRLTEVRVVMDKKTKKKTLFNADTDELIETQFMNDSDFERLPLDLTGGSKKKKHEGATTNVGDAIEEATNAPEGADQAA